MRGDEKVHDVSLLAWVVLAAVRAIGRGRAGPIDALVVTVNLVSGMPFAWRRVRQGRRDVVALAAPVAVGCAVVTTARPGMSWTPAAATSVLLVLRAVERRSATHHSRSSP